MIADASMLASTWQGDSWLCRDNLPYDEGKEAKSLFTARDQTHSVQGSTYLTSGSCSPSFVGSDCSEFLNDEDSLQLAWDLDSSTCDIMQQTMMSVLGDAAPSDEDTEYNVVLDSTETLFPKVSSLTSSWSRDFTNSPVSNSLHSCTRRESVSESDVYSSSAESVVPSAPSSPHGGKDRPSMLSTPAKARPHSSKSKKHKKWCDLSAAEKVSVVEELTTTISQQLGLREQLEVISIIKPDASVSQADTEFVIELSWINEKTLQQVHDYLERHQRSSLKSAPSKSTHQPKAGCINDGRVTKRGRRREKQEIRVREKKEQKQVIKEERSGLFVQEQVLALASSSSDDDDIDILT